MGWACWAVTFERLPCSLMKSRKRTRPAGTSGHSAARHESARCQKTSGQREYEARSTSRWRRSREGAEDSGGMPPNDSDLRRLPPDDEQSRHPRTAARVAEYRC